MVIASGIVTSRTSFSLGSLEAMPLRRCVRRRNEATERSRTSSARSAVTSVRRPRCFSTPARGAGRGAAGVRAAPGRRGRGASSSSASSARRAPGPARAAIVARRSASWRLRRLCVWFPRRACGVHLPRACALQPLPARCDRPTRGLRGGVLLLRRSCALRLRARENWRAHARVRLRSSSVRVRSTTPDGFRLCLGLRRSLRVQSAPAGVLLGAGFFVSTTGAGSALASPGPPTARRLTFSTTTCLLRPWLKL